MTVLKRRATFLSVIESNIGNPCPCCLERNEFETMDGSELAKNARLFQKVFGVSVITRDSVVAFRLVPVPKGIEKRGEDFFYHPDNLYPSCCNECREEYQKMWLYHPERVSFIDQLVTSGVSVKKIKVTGGRVR